MTRLVVDSVVVLMATSDRDAFVAPRVDDCSADAFVTVTAVTTMQGNTVYAILRHHLARVAHFYHGR